jgi:hypothetical protein
VRTLEPRPGRELTSTGLTVAVEARRALRCGHGHPDRTERRAALRAMDQQTATARRTLRVREGCGACGLPLELPQRRTTRHVTVEPELAAPFTLTLTLPVSRCPDCGVDNLSTVTGRRVRALVHRLFTDA